MGVVAIAEHGNIYQVRRDRILPNLGIDAGEVDPFVEPVSHPFVAGVGYDLNIPLSTYDKLPAPGATTTVLTHLVVREDAHTLYGFATPEERDLFLLLVNNVSGIGPKLALAVLNGIAHDPTTDTFLITGKRWPTIFQVRISD